MPEAVSDPLHQAMAARIAKGELPGLVTLVARGGDVQVDTIGVMAFGSNEPMRRDAIFRIASLTKPILATATMILVEEGKLALDEPVQRLLPELAAHLRSLGYEGNRLFDVFAADPPAAELLHDEFPDFEAGAADAVLPDRMDHATCVSLGRVRPPFDR